MKLTLCALVVGASLTWGCGEIKEEKPKKVSSKVSYFSNIGYQGKLPEKCSTVLGMSYSGGSGASFQVACENFDGTYSLYEPFQGDSWMEIMRLEKNK